MSVHDIKKNPEIETISRKIKTIIARKEKVPLSLQQQALQITIGLSCSDVARVLRVNKSTVSRWRNGFVSENQSGDNEATTRRQQPCNDLATVLELPSNTTLTNDSMRYRPLALGVISLLIIASTLLLVLEARLFYAHDSNATMAVIKASMIEVCVLYLAFFRTKTYLTHGIKTLMLGILISFSAYTISTHVVTNSVQGMSKHDMILSEISILKKELELKEQKIQLNISLDRLSTAMKLDRDKTEIVNKIDTLTKLYSGMNKLVGKCDMYSLLVFRLILLLMNVLFTHHLRNIILLK